MGRSVKINKILCLTQSPEVFHGPFNIRIRHEETVLAQGEQEPIFHRCVVKKIMPNLSTSCKIKITLISLVLAASQYYM